MSDWSDLGLPAPNVEGYGYSIAAGFLRTPFPTAHPRQLRRHTRNQRTFSTSVMLTQAQLSAATEFLEASGFEGFTIGLIYGRQHAVVTDLEVRVSDNYTVDAVGLDWYKLSFVLEAFTLAAPIPPPCDTYWQYVNWACDFETGLVDLSQEAQPLAYSVTSGIGIGTSRNGTPTLYGTISTDNFSTAVNSAAIAFGTGDFTVEFFYRFPTVAYTNGSLIFNNPVTPVFINWDATAGGIFGALNNATIKTGTISISLGEWHHIALIRNSNVLELYVDGVPSGSPLSYTYNLTYGQYSFLPRLNGNLGSLRVKKGVAVYTSAFTPPTEDYTVENDPSPLLTTLMMNFITGVVDLSPVNNTITHNCCIHRPQAGLAALCATSNSTYIYNSVNTEYEFGLWDFTIEFFWVRDASRTAAAQYLLDSSPSGGLGIRLLIDNTIAGNIDAAANMTGAMAVTAGAYHHIALVRKDDVLELYVDGIPSGAPYSLRTYIENSKLQFYPTNRGTIDNIRITKGYARYTAAFTPPEVPYIYTSCGLLPTPEFDVVLDVDLRGTVGQTAFVDRSPSAHTLTTVGSTACSAAAPWSDGQATCRFATDGNRIDISDSSDFVWGTMDSGTIEGYVWADATGSRGAALLSCMETYLKLLTFYVSNDITGVNVLVGATGLPFVNNLGNISPAGRWVHYVLAWSPVSGTQRVWKMWVDGVLHRWTNAVNVAGVGGATKNSIGGTNHTNNYTWDGHMAWIRVTRGVRYTDTFTPPAIP